MHDIESSKAKIQRICEQIRHEAIDPAKHEAVEIVKRAQEHAQQIVKQAEIEARTIAENNRKLIEKEQQIAAHVLMQSGKQAISALKQEIEQQLFHPALARIVEPISQQPQVIANFITAIINAIDKEGIHAHLSAMIPQSIAIEDVNKLLAAEIIQRLTEKSVLLGSFQGGAQIRWHDKHMVIDLTDQALKELITNYVSKDFHHLLFPN